MQSAQAPQGTCYCLKNVPQIWGAIYVASILQGRPPLLRADGVLSDAQWMGSYDWALRLVLGAKDVSPHSYGVFMVLHPESQ